MEDNDALERHANISLQDYIEQRQNGDLDNADDFWNERENTSIFYTTDGNASITTNWGLEKVDTGIIADGYFNYSGDFQGDKVSEAENEIVSQHSAPYLDTTTHGQDNSEKLEIEFSLPLDYDQNDWEETVDTLLAISQDIEEYQETLHTASEQYLKSI